MPYASADPDTLDPSLQTANLLLGCHLSISRGFHQAGLDALSIGANTFQFFTRNPRGGRAKALDQNDVDGLASTVRSHCFGPLLAHAPYTLNPCSEKESVREFARSVLREDLSRVARLPPGYYVMHPGSRGKMPLEAAIGFIAEALNEALREESEVTVLLEGMSGKGSEVGGTFDELRAIIDAVDGDERVGVCLDTCHLFASGYDIVGDLDGVLSELESVVGLERVKAVHLNDSMFGLGARKDRHARIGEGEIGTSAIIELISHPSLRKLPFGLETPGDLESWAGEIALLRDRCHTAMSCG